MNEHSGWKNILLLLIPGGLWGSSFLLTEIVLLSMPPITFTAARNLLAAVGLVALLYGRNGRLHNSWRTWLSYLAIGIFSNALPFTLISWGQLSIDSGLASILVSTMPLFTIVLAHFFTEDERLTRQKLVGVLLGFSGIVVLIGPVALRGLGQSLGGQLAVTAAAVCYAVGAILSRRFLQTPRLRSLSPTVRSLEIIAGQFLTTAVFFIPFALLIEGVPTQLPTLPSLLALLASAWPMTIIAIVVYYHLIDSVGTTFASLSVYLIPVFGLFLGVLILDEPLTPTALLALLLILAGVAAVNGLFSRRKRVLSQT